MIDDLPRALRRHARLLPESGCWVIDCGLTKAGYARVKIDGSNPLSAHRLSYEALVGPIPEGLTIDHVKDRGCVSKACANPAHLEPVTSRENTLRGDNPAARQARKIECLRGHSLAPEDPNVRLRGSRRYCRACIRIRRQEKRARQW